MSNANPYVQHFDEPREPLLETLGGKGASLVSMTSVGMPVPPGFVVTTACFDAFMHEAGIAERIHANLETLDPDDVDAVETLAGKIRTALTERPVPDAARAAVREAYRELMQTCGGEVPVAVRSSATAEDLPDASFAGQQETYLWQIGERAVLEHIRQCWASLYTTRAILYRLKNNIPNEGLSMAVVVQKMVNARVAGVAMTLNPTDGDRSKIAIDSSWGVGEMVVSGEVTPDHLLVEKVTYQIVEEHLGDKHVELVADPDAKTLIQREVEPERAQRRSLTDDEVRQVAEMAKRAEKHYKTPQDIEWALDADLPDGESLLLLQSRPETVHSLDSGASSSAGKSSSQSAGAKTSATNGAFDLTSITASFTAPTP